MSVSKLRFFSTGIAAENKPLNSDSLEITPVEELPLLDGEVTDNVTHISTQGTNLDGRAYESTIQSTSTITAQWLPFCNGNRMSSPDIRRGAVVMLYQMADEKKYYWTTLKHDVELRRLETVIYAFSATKVENTPFSADNYYFLEVSTHKGLVHFHSSKANGEPFEYDITLNTKDGIFTLKDDIENAIIINSKEKRVRLESSMGSFIEIFGKDINIHCEGDYNLNVLGERTETVLKNSSEVVSGDKSIKSSNNTLTADHNLMDAPSNVFAGDFSVDGGNGASGDGQIKGMFNFLDSISVKNKVDVEGELTAKKVTSIENISAPNV